DLWRCLAEWQAHRHIAEFSLGQHDASDRLLIPEKLYGREREIATLLTAFDRVVTGGRRSWCWFPAIPGSANPSLSMSCTNPWFLRAAFLHRASSISTSAIFLMPPWRRPFRASSARF